MNTNNQLINIDSNNVDKSVDVDNKINNNNNNGNGMNVDNNIDPILDLDNKPNNNNPSPITPNINNILNPIDYCSEQDSDYSSEIMKPTHQSDDNNHKHMLFYQLNM